MANPTAMCSSSCQHLARCSSLGSPIGLQCRWGRPPDGAVATLSAALRERLALPRWRWSRPSRPIRGGVAVAPEFAMKRRPGMVLPGPIAGAGSSLLRVTLSGWTASGDAGVVMRSCLDGAAAPRSAVAAVVIGPQLFLGDGTRRIIGHLQRLARSCLAFRQD